MSWANASGFNYDEYYLYAKKTWEDIPIGVSIFTLASGVFQNAPIVVTSSGYETTLPYPWAQVSGSGKYTKVGRGYFTLDSAGIFDTSCDEFYLDPDNNKKLVFNKTLDEHLFVEYETQASGYYVMNTLDFRPERGHMETDFLDFSYVSHPDSLYLITTQKEILGDGFQTAKLIATVFDDDYDRVRDVNVVFELQGISDYVVYGYLEPYEGTHYMTDPSGFAMQVLEKTDAAGRATVKYKALKGQQGVQDVKAYCLGASGVDDTAKIAQVYSSAAVTGSGFILNQSLLDSNDYLV